jgi:hypothetical protein
MNKYQNSQIQMSVYIHPTTCLSNQTYNATAGWTGQFTTRRPFNLSFTPEPVGVTCGTGYALLSHPSLSSVNSTWTRSATDGSCTTRFLNVTLVETEIYTIHVRVEGLANTTRSLVFRQLPGTNWTSYVSATVQTTDSGVRQTLSFDELPFCHCPIPSEIEPVSGEVCDFPSSYVREYTPSDASTTVVINASHVRDTYTLELPACLGGNSVTEVVRAYTSPTAAPTPARIDTTIFLATVLPVFGIMFLLIMYQLFPRGGDTRRVATQAPSTRTRGVPSRRTSTGI